MNRTASAPLRIDFCGGSLDIQPIPGEMGPVSIISAAINRRVEGRFCTPTSHITGTENTILTYSMPAGVPTSSGLGSSGVMNVVWLALVTGRSDPHWIASRVYRMEQATDVVGGVQDQYTASYGGVNEIVMNGNRVWIQPLLSREDPGVKELQSRLVLVDSGISRSATNMNRQFIERYKKGELYSELNALKGLSLETRKAIGYHNYCPHSEGYKVSQNALKLSGCLNQEWSLRKKLMPSKVEEIDGIIGAVRGALLYPERLGAKVHGAGGGGCILFYHRSPAATDKVRAAAEKEGCKVIDFQFDFDGLVVEEETE